MTRFLRFFSFAALTQIVLLLNQIVLLPVQLHTWGTAITASWYAAIALATITTFADLGLRTAGHVELLRFVNDGDESGGRHIRQLWGWIRILVGAITLLLLAWSWLQSWMNGGQVQAFWKSALTVAYAIETLLIIRIVFLDSLGKYNQAESSYFTFAVLRFGLALPALLWLKLQPQGLALLFVLTSVAGIALQGRICRRLGVLGLLDPLPPGLSLAVIATARYTMAEPLLTWVRISLPVLVIASFSTPAAVTIFVALRAVFGASRTTIQQLARVASVEYLQLRASRRPKAARVLLTAFVQAAGFLGVAIGGLVIVDNLRLLGLVLKNYDSGLFQMVAASFAFSGAFYAHQIIVNVMFRVGQLAAVAYRQYAFVLCSGAFSLVGVVVKSLPVYLCLIVVAELILATSFMLRGRTSAPEYLVGRRGFAGAVAGVVMLVTLSLAVQMYRNTLFLSASLTGAWASMAAVIAGATVLAMFQAFLNIDRIRISGSAGLARMFTAR